MNLYDYKFTPWREKDGKLVRSAESAWKKPTSWNRKAKDAREIAEGQADAITLIPARPRVLLTVDPFADVLQEWRDRLFALMEEFRELDWVVVTERPEHVVKACGICCNIHGVPQHIFLGVKVRTQAEADRLIPELLRVPAKTRFVWVEPEEALDLSRWIRGRVLQTNDGRWLINTDPGAESVGGTWLSGPNWIIVSGGTNPMHPEWVRALRDQAKAASVPFWFDGWGEYTDMTNAEDGDTRFKKSTCDEIFTSTGEVLGAGYRHRRETNGMVDVNWKERGGAWMAKLGRKQSGRILDGRTHDGVPS